MRKRLPRICNRCGKKYTTRGKYYCSNDCSKKPYDNEKDGFYKNVKIVENNKCWIWIGTINKAGYGQLHHNKHLYLAHRLSWMIYNGAIPKGLGVLHHCDNPSCVNPSHLFLGTSKDNVADKVSKHRQAIGEKQGCSKLSELQVKEIKRNIGIIPTKELALRYNVSTTLIRYIKIKKLWKHVQL